MNKLYLDLRYISCVPDAYKANSSLLMSFAGANTGNYAFRHALKSLVHDIEDYKTITNSDINSELAKGQPESVLMSCANWLSVTDQYEKSNGVRAKLYDKFKCPVVSLGLGAQAPSDSSKISLGPNTKKMAGVLADKCQTLSVRDEYTADVLARLGIKNTVVTGCPSNFINLDRQLGAKIIEKTVTQEKSTDWHQIRTHIAEVSGGHTMSKHVLAATLEFLDNSSSFYVIQSPNLLPFLLRETDEIHPLYLNNTPFTRGDKSKLRSVLKKKLMCFSSIEAWLDFARTCDLAVGMRIHGNMIPLQAGVPSIVISHDSRTSGLSGFMGIPSMDPAQFMEYSKTKPAAIFELIGRKMEAYDTTRLRLAKIMSAFLKENDIATTSSLEAFVS